MKRGKFRKAVFVVTYAKKGNNVEYLILKRRHHWSGWEFPKGGMRLFEGKKHAVKREIKEETGLKLINIKKFDTRGKYRYQTEFSDRRGIIGQTFSLYAAEVKRGKVKIDEIEHSEYKWLKFNEAVKKLTWNNQKECLKAVDKWLSKK